MISVNFTSNNINYTINILQFLFHSILRIQIIIRFPSSNFILDLHCMNTTRQLNIWNILNRSTDKTSDNLV